MTAINPYLMFNGNCEEAFDFYESVFRSGSLEKNRYKEAPDQQIPGSQDKLMHAALPIGNGYMLMGSDTPSDDMRVSIGNNFSVSLSTDSEDEADKLFGKLSEGGKVTMQLSKTFWNAYFGMCTDKFGINWMVSYDYEKRGN
jgi:PhnB protein